MPQPMKSTEPSNHGGRAPRALVILLYFALAAISSYFNDFEAVEMSALRQELENREAAGQLPKGQSLDEIAASTYTLRR